MWLMLAFKWLHQLSKIDLYAKNQNSYTKQKTGTTITALSYDNQMMLY